MTAEFALSVDSKCVRLCMRDRVWPGLGELDGPNDAPCMPDPCITDSGFGTFSRILCPEGFSAILQRP